jgi:hypothetical protein
MKPETKSELPRVIDAITKFADIQRRTTMQATDVLEQDYASAQLAAADFARRILAVAPECLSACSAGDLHLAAELAGRMMMLARLAEQRALAGVERRSSGQKAVLLFAQAIPKPRHTRPPRAIDFETVQRKSFTRKRRPPSTPVQTDAH